MAKVIFTADLHGNERQYGKLVDYAVESAADSLIIGGDIAPKYFPDDPTGIKRISGQKDFLENRLPDMLSSLKKARPSCQIYILFGNDDCAINQRVLESKAEGIYTVIHNRRVPLGEGYDIVGYSCVPFTPFGLKDWERKDLRKFPENAESDYVLTTKEARLEGLISTPRGLQYKIESEILGMHPSIEEDLSTRLFTANPEKTVYVIHTPPYGTNLDKLERRTISQADFDAIMASSPLDEAKRIVERTFGKHSVGSLAVRRFIEKYQPYLTLHGHIHETVSVSKKFKDKIGSTLCMTAGNSNRSKNLAVVEFELGKPEKAKRLILEL